jgi:hypothetical protein
MFLSANAALLFFKRIASGLGLTGRGRGRGRAAFLAQPPDKRHDNEDADNPDDDSACAHPM